MKITIIHGPNLNLLGQREKSVYGQQSLKDIETMLLKTAKDASSKAEKISLSFFQSNHEGDIVSCIQKANTTADAIVMNPAAFTHTSVAIRDAVAAIGIPVIEVHLSNIHARENFRKESYVSPVAAGVVFGFGADSYRLGLLGAIEKVREAASHTKS